MSALPPNTALNFFLHEVQGRAVRVAEIATRSREDALDIVQEAMLHLARSYSGHPSNEWPPLFYRILENKIRDHQRRAAVRSRIFFWQAAKDPDNEDQTSPENNAVDLSIGDASERLMRNEAIGKIDGILKALPARQRQAFTLRIWEGLSTDDTARVMGCSDGSVKTHLWRALSVLKKELGDVWGGSE